MTIAYFVSFHQPAGRVMQVSATELTQLRDIIRAIPGLQRGLVFTPENINHPYEDDEPAPPLALELYFAGIAQCEAALARQGPLQILAEPQTLPSLVGTRPLQQAMLARSFPVPQPEFAIAPGEPHYSFLVHYPGQAENLNNWLHYYLTNHTREMAKFPGIRQIEVCTRIDWVGFLPWQRIDYMQRNKVVFDSAAALDAALASPVRSEMRADYYKFPAFTGSNRHYPMATHLVLPQGPG